MDFIRSLFLCAANKCGQRREILPLQKTGSRRLADSMNIFVRFLDGNAHLGDNEFLS